MSESQARAFLERNGLAAHRKLGQNFLHDDQLVDKLVRQAGVGAGDAVIEVGTGLGHLSRGLARVAARVSTIEIDAGLVRALRAEEALPANVELLHADAMEVDLGTLVARLGPRVRVVANLPYSVATPLLRRFLDLAPLLLGWAVMLQKEVATRLTAKVGESGYGSLAVLHQLVADTGRALDLHPRCFYPVPKVVSTFVPMTPRSEMLATAELARVERVARAGFAYRRKTLANSLRQSGFEPVRVSAAILQQGLHANARAEQVPPGAWSALAAALNDGGPE